MTGIVTIHQPDHIPWLGLLNKIDQADLYVILDCVQLSKRAFQHRNRVIGATEQPTWLTVPLATPDHQQHRLSDMLINNAVPWQRRYRNIIYERYHRHPAWSEHEDYLETLWSRPFERLVDLNLDIMRYLTRALGITTPMVLASSLSPQGSSSALMLDICRKAGAGCYLAGPLSRRYLDEGMLRRAGIGVRYHDFDHPVYEQFGKSGFTSHLCAIDLLMNQGQASLDTIRSGTRDPGTAGLPDESEPTPSVRDQGNR